VPAYQSLEAKAMFFLLWLILLFFCWPLALVALVMIPVLWLLLLPLRILGLAIHAPLVILWTLVMLPFVLLRGPRHSHHYYYAQAYPPPPGYPPPGQYPPPGYGPYRRW